MTDQGDRQGAFCRDCLAVAADDATRCGHCRSPRLLRHPELHQLQVAHLDCDAFYAAVEKRDDPSLRDKPVISLRDAMSMTKRYLTSLFSIRW